MIAYLDASAALKLVVSEPETETLSSYLQSEARDSQLEVLAGWLLHTELHCAARRRPETVAIEKIRQVLDVVTLVDLERADLLTAGLLPGRLRTGDAIHLAVALRTGVDSMITYDVELQEAALAAGLAVVAPR